MVINKIKCGEQILHSVINVVVDRYTLIFSRMAESVQLCYTNHNVHVCIVHTVHVVVLVVNNLIRAHYNIIMKAIVASGGKLPVS